MGSLGIVVDYRRGLSYGSIYLMGRNGTEWSRIKEFGDRRFFNCVCASDVIFLIFKTAQTHEFFIDDGYGNKIAQETTAY